MKKLLSILVIGIFVFLPLSVSAAKIEGTCEKNEDCPDDVCQSICTIRVTGNTSTIQEFEGDLVFTPADGGEIVEVQAGEDFTNLSGNDAHISFIAANGTGVTASSFTLAKVILNVDKDVVGCSLKLTNPSVGTEVKIDVEVTEEVNTGATLPIAILACGVGAGAIIYAISRKNKKLYKI